MRILFDTRSVRTPAGYYVFQGITAGWLQDGRVERVIAGVRPGFNHSHVPAGVEIVEIASRNWISHITRAVPRTADRVHADIIFAPNALAPRDSRSVLFFQDLLHFRPQPKRRAAVRHWTQRASRASWRAFAAPGARLAVAVSGVIFDEVRRHIPTPTVLIPNGVDVSGASWQGDGDYVLIMGGTGQRKDEATGLHAWAALPANLRGQLQVDVVGVEPAERRSALRNLARMLGIEHSTRISGAIARPAFLERVAHARLAISCTLLEAFGLPAAEALAMGAPLLCSDIPAHAELVRGAGAGQTFTPGNATALAAQLQRVLEGATIRRVESRLAGWTWKERARSHIDAYDRAALTPTRSS